MIRTKQQTSFFFLFLFSFFFLYLFLSRGVLTGGDDVIYMDIARDLLENGSSANFLKDPRISKFSIGQPIIDIPIAFHLKKAWGSINVNDFLGHVYHVFIIAIWASFLAALEVAVFYLVCLSLGFTTAVSVLSTLSFGMCTMMLVYSQKLFADTTIGFLWLLAFLLINRYQTTRQPKFLLYSGFFLGYSIITKPYAALFVLVFCLYFLRLLWLEIKPLSPISSHKPFFIIIKEIMAEKKHQIGLKLFFWGGPILLFIGLQFYYNYWRYDDILKFGYDAVGVDKYVGFSNPVLVGLFGLLFSPGKGVLWYNPILFLSLYGAVCFYKEAKGKAIFLGVLITTYFLFISHWVGWSGDYSWGPRYLMSILPFMALPLGFFYKTLFENFRKFLKKKATKSFFVIILFFLSLSIQVIGIIPDNNEYVVYVRDSIKIFPHSNYIPKVWPLRDTEFMMHYVPDFSPIPGHLWIINVIRHRNSEKLTLVLNNPPWRGLNNQWVPRDQIKNPFRYNIWWLTALQMMHPHRTQILLLAYAIFAASFLGFYIIIRLLIIDFIKKQKTELP